MAVWCLVYTQSMPRVEICLIGDFWNEVLAGLKYLAIKQSEFDLVSVYESVDSFITKTK